MPEQTTTTQIDPQLQALISAFLNNAGVIASRPYSPYTGDRVAANNPLLDQAAVNAGALAGSAPWAAALGEGSNYVRAGALPITPAMMGGYPSVSSPQVGSIPQVTASGYRPDLVGNISSVVEPDILAKLRAGVDFSKAMIDPVSLLISERFTPEASRYYMNPYTESVVDTTMSDIDRMEGQKRVGNDLRAAGAGAYGGAALALEQAELGRNTDDLRARTSANLRERAYESGYDKFAADVGRDIAVGQQNIANEMDRRKTNAGTIINEQLQDRSGLQYLADLMMRARQGDQAAANQAKQFLAAAQNTASSQNASNDLTRQTGNADRVVRADTANQGAAITVGQANQNAANSAMAGNRSALMGAGQYFGNLGPTIAGLGWGDVNNLSRVGSTMQGLDQSRADAAYQDYLMSQGWDRNQASWLGQMLFGAPRSQTQTTTTPGASSTGQAIGAATALAGLLRGTGAVDWLGNQIGNGVSGLWNSIFPSAGGELLNLSNDFGLDNFGDWWAGMEDMGLLFANGGYVDEDEEDAIVGALPDDEDPTYDDPYADDAEPLEGDDGEDQPTEGGEEEARGALPVVGNGAISPQGGGALAQIARMMETQGGSGGDNMFTDPLLALGLGILTAASRPGANTLGAVGEGGMVAQRQMAANEAQRLAQKRLQQQAILKGIELDQKGVEAEKNRASQKDIAGVRAEATRYGADKSFEGRRYSADLAARTAAADRGASLQRAMIAANSPTEFERALVAAGLKPGSPEYQEQAMEYVKRKGTGQTINVDNKAEGAEAKKRGEFYGQKYIDIVEGEGQARSQNAKLDRVGGLLDQVNTGALTETTTNIKALAKSLGIDLTAVGIKDDVGPAQAARALANEIALNLRNPAGGAGMPGALSDKDREFLVSMTPGLSQTPEGRKMLLETYRKINDRSIEVSKRARDYVKKAGRLDEGFFDELATMYDSKPLFPDVPAAPAAPTVPRAPAQAPAAARPAPTPSQSLPQPKTQEEYDALPVGAEYITPMGKKLIKGGAR